MTFENDSCALLDDAAKFAHSTQKPGKLLQYMAVSGRSAPIPPPRPRKLLRFDRGPLRFNSTKQSFTNIPFDSKLCAIPLRHNMKTLDPHYAHPFTGDAESRRAEATMRMFRRNHCDLAHIAVSDNDDDAAPTAEPVVKSRDIAERRAVDSIISSRKGRRARDVTSEIRNRHRR
jgi:hypothetical protein